MSESLHILILEDNRADAELTLFELEDAGFVVSAKVVETEKDYIRELQESCYDLILSDYDLPLYNGALALQEATRRCPDTPFILLSGVVTEDRAIEILTQGAKDYVLKNRLQQRLVPAVRRALTEANEQRARKKAEEELREAHKNLERQVDERTAELQRELERRRVIEQTLLKYNERLEILSYTAARLLASDRPQQIVEELCLKVMAFLDCQTFFNFLVDETAGRLHLNACAGIPSETAREIEWLDFGVAVCGCVARDGLRIVAENIPRTPDVRTELIKSFGIKAYACHPLKQQDRVIGTLSFGTRTRTTFNADELAMMKAVADQVAIAMSRVRMEDALRESEARTKRHAAEMQAVMDLAPIAVWIAHDPECRRITGNRYANEIMQVLPDANVSAGAPPGDAAVSYKVTRGGKEMNAWELPAQTAARTGQPVKAEMHDLVFSDGRMVKIVLGAVPFVDSAGRVAGAVAAGTDVTEIRQTEETLLQMTERFEMAQLAAGVGIWDWNIVTGRLEWSKQMFDLFGLDPQKNEASFESWRNALHPDDIEKAGQRINESLSQKTPLNNEYRIILPDGRIRWISAIGEGKYDGAGSPVRMIGICMDVTERKEAEQALRENERTQSNLLARLNEAQRVAVVGSWEWNLRTDQVWWSDETYRIFDVTPGNYVPGFEANGAFIHPDDFEQYGRVFQHSLQTGEPLDFHVRLILRNGQLKHCHARGIAIYDDSRQPCRFVGTIMDITERRLAEEALTGSEARFRAVLDNSRDVIYCLNVQTGRFEYISPSAESVVGYSPQALTEQSGEKALAMIHPDDLPAMQVALTLLDETGKADAEYRQRDKLGGYHWLSNHMSQTRDEAGRPLYRYGNIRDITLRRRTEEALFRSEERFRRYFDLGLIGMAVAAPDKGITEVNEKFCEMTGYEKNELLQMTWAQLTHPDDPGNDLSHFEQMLAGKCDGYSTEKRFIRKDSGMIDTILAVRCVRTAQGSIDSFLALIEDITGRKRVETQREAALAALRESEKKYRNLVQYAPAAIYEMDVQGTQFLSVNDVMCDILGYSREELLAVKPADLLAEEGREYFRERIEKKLTGEKIAETIEYKIRKKDGRWIDVTVNVGTITYSDEASPRIAVIAHDITERKRAEDAILKAKEEWEQTFDTVPDLIAILDQDHRILRVNKAMAKALGATPEQCVGLMCHEVVHGSSKPPAFCPHSLTCRDGCQHVAEVHEMRLGGDFMVSTIPLCDSAGSLIGAVHVARDITARKAAEVLLAKQATELQVRTAQLEEANRELESFSYSVSHDLRAPLRAIDGISRIILRKHKDQLDETTRRQFDMVRENAGKMNTLIDNLLAFSRVQKTGMNAAVIDMEKLVREVWEETRTANAGRDLEFRQSGLLPGYGDQALIRQVLTNLLSNAVKFTRNRKPGIVEVTSTHGSGETIYSVRDNGAGFDMEYADKLFGVFQRLHSAAQYEGTGVGLAIVQRIILRHSGRVWGEGREGEGASFSFSLPVKDA